jgi:hypothetical protein
MDKRRSSGQEGNYGQTQKAGTSTRSIAGNILVPAYLRETESSRPFLLHMASCLMLIFVLVILRSFSKGRSR